MAGGEWRVAGDGSRAAGDATTGPLYTKGQGQTEEIVGPDGVKRRVRIIDPTL